MKWEIAAIGAGIAGIALGFGFGWASHKREPSPALPYRPRYSETSVANRDIEPSFPEHPKPPLETPVPIPDLSTRAVPSLGGDLPNLPVAGPEGSGPIGTGTPMTPDLPNGPPPAADLNADEARAKRIVLESGADVISVSDARDDAGTIGRSIVAETAPSDRDPLRKALRKALGARAVISDAGAGPSDDDPGLKKMEDELALARKRRDKDRIDFLPQSPILQDEEEAVLKMERALALRRKESSRVRLNILLRPTL